MLLRRVSGVVDVERPIGYGKGVFAFEIPHNDVYARAIRVASRCGQHFIFKSMRIIRRIQQAIGLGVVGLRVATLFSVIDVPPIIYNDCRRWFGVAAPC